MRDSYGLFLVRLPDGRLLALTDRASMLGQRVYWYDPMPFLPPDVPLTAGFRDRSYGSAYHADGTRLSGPVFRPLDPFPLELSGDLFVVADRARCPAAGQVWESWCE